MWIVSIPFYFEDAIGNRDTLVIGYDTLGSHDGMLLSAFGGINIESPFDSVLEARATHFDALNFNDIPTSKRLIGGYELYPDHVCGISTDVVILLHAKYPPVKVSYDSSMLLASPCRANTILSRDWVLYFLEYWWDAYRFDCLGQTSSVTLDYLPPPVIEGDVIMANVAVEGLGIVQIPGYFVHFRFFGPYTNIGVHQVLTQVQSEMVPNPSNSACEIRFPEPYTGMLNVFGLQGNLMSNIQINNASTAILNTSSFPDGVYYVRLKPDQQVGWWQKLVIAH